MAEAAISTPPQVDFPAFAQELPEPLRNPELAGWMGKYQDINSLGKGLTELVKYSGRSVAIPGNDPAEVENWKTQHLPKLQHVFADRMPPPKPDDYEFTLEGADENAIKNDKVLGVFREQAHKLGLSKSQAAGLVEVFGKQILPELVGAPGPQIDFIQGEQVDTLMQEVFKGEATQKIDEYKRTVALLSQEIPELKDLLMSGAAPYGQTSANQALALGDHPTIIKLIGLVAKMTQPDSAGFLGGAQNQQMQDAEAEAKSIQNDKTNPKYEAYWAGRKDVVDYVNGLWEKAYPGQRRI